MSENTKNTNENLDLTMFVDRLVSEKKFPADLEKEVMDQIKADLLARVEDRMKSVILTNLTPEKLEEFNQLMGKNTPDEDMQKFFAENISNLPQVIASELIVFKDSYLS